MLTRRELRELRYKSEYVPKTPNNHEKHKERRKITNTNFKVEHIHRTYVTGYNSNKG